MQSNKIYTLKKGDIEMTVTNFGGRVMTLLVPDRQGNMADVVLGYKTVEEYIDNSGERFLGAVCGRFANRIAKGTFSIDGVSYNLPINNNGQTLHGGLKGLDLVWWDVVSYSEDELHLRYVSVDGEEGFPGELTIDMVYRLTEKNEFSIDYTAKTTKKTPVNLTHHSFFNLAGEGNGTINNHLMQIFAERFIPIDEVSIPTGEIRDVEGSPFDFRRAKPIGQDIDTDYDQLKTGCGYDHCWVIDGVGMRIAARVEEPVSGRVMEVWTDQPGMQFYGGNFFDGKTQAKSGKGSYDYRGSFALETQNFPDAPNQPNFPNSILNPGETYKHRCVYCFVVG